MPEPVDEWQVERERLRRDRERTAWLLVEAEQRIAALLARPQVVEEPNNPDLHVEIANLRRTLEALRASTSWRVTRPLRAISRVLRRKDS